MTSRRLTQHLSGKDWWEKAIVLTTKDDSLNYTEIDWLEASLIDRARSIDRLECDNHQRGNPIKVDRFREVFLRQYDFLYLSSLPNASPKQMPSM